MKYIPARNAICYITLLLVLVATMLLAPASTLEAQASVQSGTPQEEAPTVDYRFYERDVIEIKFREGQRIRLRNGALTDLSGQALENAPALAVLEAVADGTWTRTHQVNEEKLDQMRQEGLARGEKSLPDLNLWFRLQLPPGMEAAEAIALFNALDEVEGAFPVPKPAPPPLPPDYSIPNDDN